MNPLVFMILTAERDMKAQLEKQRQQDGEGKSQQTHHKPEQKTRKRFFFRLRSQKNCECL